MNAESCSYMDRTHLRFCMPFYLQGYNLSYFDLNSISVSDCSLSQEAGLQNMKWRTQYITNIRVLLRQ